MPPLRQPDESLQCKKTDMRRIRFVVPPRKCLTIDDTFGHDAQQSARFQAGPQPLQISSWIMEVFDNFRGRDEIILLLKDLLVGSVERIENVHPVSGFLEHDRERRPRPSTKVESLAGRCQPGRQGIK